MSTNLVDVLNKYLTSDVVSKLANFLGETPQNTGSALNLAVPSLLAGIVRKYTNYPETGNLLNLLKKDNHDGSVLENLQTLLGGGDATNSLLEKGSKILSSVLGENSSNLANLVASNSGVGDKSAKSLLGLALPLVLGAISKVAKAEGLSTANQFSSLLSSQIDSLKNLLPASVSSLLGFGDFAAVTEGGGFKKSLPWLLLLLPLLGWLGYRSLSNQELGTNLPEAKIEIPAVPKIAEAPAIVDQVSAFFEETLPTGFSLKGAKEGIEGKLVSFIKDATALVDKETWFTMDGITFDTGKATLKPESNAQLTNIVEILKAFPAVKIKIGGYTDNTGDDKANQKLSADRANTIKNALVAAGIDKARLEAEGYGKEHPVASNATEEGRQQNRRIDVRVTAK